MKRQDRSYWLQHYKNWLQSSSGKVVFAMEYHLSITAFYYWFRKFEKETISLEARGNDKRSFQQISPPLDMHTSTSTSIVSDASTILCYPSGISIEWRGSVDIHLLKALLS